jgi:alanyl-tRNA synthetase
VQKHGHTFVPSSPVVPLDDPTLLFTNAGMNQFKPIFLGQEKRAYTRAANTQKCIRAGGKHNDLDDVGRSAAGITPSSKCSATGPSAIISSAAPSKWRGNCSPRSGNSTPRACTSVATKATRRRHPARHRSRRSLEKNRRPARRSHPLFRQGQFLGNGRHRPLRPLHRNLHRPHPDKTGGPQVNGEDPRVMEIWNLVFIQYNRDAAGKLTPLPAQHVDTGMGLERICQVIQEKRTITHRFVDAAVRCDIEISN